MATNRTEYMCSFCGLKTSMLSSQGRPQPGSCSKKGKTKDGKSKPHSWVINRKY